MLNVLKVRFSRHFSRSALRKKVCIFFAGGPGSCSYGKAIPTNDNNTCYILSTQANTWEAAQSSCASIARNFGQPPSPLATGRVATFPQSDMSEYLRVLKTLNPTAGPVDVWLGAKSFDSGITLDRYCWMSDGTNIGSQVTQKQILAPTTASPSAFCLYTSTDRPDTFHGDYCSQGSGRYAVCELSKYA